jgi:hypothetical protein
MIRNPIDEIFTGLMIPVIFVTVQEIQQAIQSGACGNYKRQYQGSQIHFSAGHA